MSKRRLHMGRKFFTEEELADLRNNPCVYSVSRSTLVLTKSFKEIFYTEYMEGATSKEIFVKYGFDPDVLGRKRVDGARQHIMEEYAKYGGFYEGKRPSSQTETTEETGPEAQLKFLTHRVEYLEQQIEFLKKLSSIRNTKK